MLSEAIKETEAKYKRKLEEAVMEIEAKYKRKVEEAFQCTVCLGIPKEGQIAQCENCLGNNRSNTCPSCRGPLAQGNKKIRALAVEQLIESVDLPFQCKHTDCEFSASKKETIAHEKECEYRLVPCLHEWCCEDQWPLRDLLGHMQCEESEQIRTGEYAYTLELNENELNQDNVGYTSNVMRYEKSAFLSRIEKTDGIFYIYTRILGDHKEAQNFKVVISIGEGGPSALIHIGQIFPIDARKEDILKEKSGVLSFNPIGMGETFFEDVEGKKELVINFKIRKAQDLPLKRVLSLDVKRQEIWET